ncbi:hypothetical protein AB0A05_37310 [Streptomyces sp. NPDC046374]|uniref:hypothetical protein n=1 Tax=Streptomyces sp. NPDC046374 TaxID=3154917 RepID=UPI0033E97BBE
MKIVRITWVQAGTDERQVSAVTYSEKAAETYGKREAAEEGVTDVQVIESSPASACRPGAGRQT